MAFTTTPVVPAAEVQPLTVIVTEYVPASAVVAFARVGFCRDDVNPFGPLHAYVAAETAGVERAIVAPSQYRPRVVEGGGAGLGCTWTLVVSGAEVQPG